MHATRLHSWTVQRADLDLPVSHLNFNSIQYQEGFEHSSHCVWKVN